MSHSDHNNHDSKHMWWMMAGCILLPMFLVLFSGRINTSGGERSWVWFIPAIVLIAFHLGRMRRHGAHGTRKEDERPKSGSEGKGDSGCCH
ncbi:MAG: hypothetical protein WC659_03615 [Patescibacteria group bacterium]